MGQEEEEVGVEPGGAPLRPKAPLWVDRWLGGRSVVLLMRYLGIGESRYVHPKFYT